MFSALECTIAMRYLRAKRKEGFISVISAFSLLGICLGVATLIVVMSVMNGFREELLSKLLGLNSHVTVTNYTEGILDYESLLNDIRTAPSVAEAHAVINGQVVIIANEVSTGIIAKGMSYEALQELAIIRDHMKEGSLEAIKEGKILLGSQLARQLGVKIGDEVTFISPQGNRTVIGFIPRLKTFIVGGIFEAGVYDFDKSAAYIPLKDAQLFFRYKETVNSIEIMLHHAEQTEQAREEIVPMVQQTGYITDWKDSNVQFFTALDVERNVMFLILTLIILVAAFNIISSLIMLVNDKRKHIAILRTMGATRGSITRIFFLCGSSIGITGSVLGVVLGVSFAANIKSIQHAVESLFGVSVFNPMVYFLSELPAKIEVSEVTAVFAMAIGLSFFATLYPAWKASKEHPAEALRYE